MADPIWGMLAKSQVDPEKIEEAIIRLIVAHNNDETSHLEVGQSLQSHKASEIIDHLAESIVEDKFATGSVSSRAITTDQLVGKDIRTDLNVGATQDGVKLNVDGIEMWQSGEKRVAIPKTGNAFFRGEVAVNKLSFLRQTWQFPFESVDAYQKSLPVNATIEPFVQALKITQSDELNAVTSIAVGEVNSISLAWAKNPSIEFAMKTGDAWGQDIYVVWGSIDPFGSTEGAWFGFRVKHTDEKVYAVSRLAGGSVSETELVGVNPELLHLYRAEVVSGGAQIKFFVDSVLIYTRTLSGTTQTTDYFFAVAVKTEYEESHATFIWNMVIQQDL